MTCLTTAKKTQLPNASQKCFAEGQEQKVEVHVGQLEGNIKKLKQNQRGDGESAQACWLPDVD